MPFTSKKFTGLNWFYYTCVWFFIKIDSVAFVHNFFLSSTVYLSSIPAYYSPEIPRNISTCFRFKAGKTDTHGSRWKQYARFISRIKSLISFSQKLDNLFLISFIEVKIFFIMYAEWKSLKICQTFAQWLPTSQNSSSSPHAKRNWRFKFKPTDLVWYMRNHSELMGLISHNLA